ncbi:deoxyribonuclease V [Actinospica sp.]|uniref:deoxyribonuclease V n=1 Tax=Actinospica sp. TaxID=1872142 RepID=UPI002C8F3706|nr:deoxyribonuclease V [Actinospica sp.]HWG25167.1 deoxyribonuclease V [Actinospica sp.]
MKLEPFSVPATEAEAIAEQDRLRPLVRAEGPAPEPLRWIAGLDVAYAVDESRVAGAVTVLDATTLEVVETATALRSVDFPYVPGLLAFREIPALVDALDKLTCVPDLLVCDGYGLAHPRRFGLACHLGVLTDVPTFGVAKTTFIGTFDEPGQARGDRSDLVDEDEVIGRVLRTQPNIKPVFVSVGHHISLDAATDLALRLAPKYRLPETTRQSDQASRRALAAGTVN